MLLDTVQIHREGQTLLQRAYNLDSQRMSEEKYTVLYPRVPSRSQNPGGELRTARLFLSSHGGFCPTKMVSVMATHRQ